MGGKFAADDNDDDMDGGKVILYPDKMMLVLPTLLMVAEIKMNENLIARKTLNSWKLKLHQETHEEGRQQMIEA